MTNVRSRRNRSSTPSVHRVTPLGRAFSTTPQPHAQRRRSTTSRPSTCSSQQANARRTSLATPRPIASRSNIAEEALEDDDDSFDHRILAFDRTAKKTLGAAYFVARDGVMSCMEDIEDADDDVIANLKTDIQPTVVLLSPRLAFRQEELAASGSIDTGNSDDPILPYRVELRPANDFRFEQAVQKLASIPTLEDTAGVRILIPGEEDEYNHFQDEMGMSDERGRSLHISGTVNLDSQVSIGCAGAVVTYLQRKKAAEYLQGDPAADEAYQIVRLEVFSLKNTMRVNADTIAALQILQPESHPNAAKQGPGSYGSKESLSIFGLFYHFARTPQGKQCLRRMFIHPSTDIDEIKNRLDSISIFAKSENSEALRKLSKSLSKIKNMQRIMTMLHKGIEGGTNTTKSIKSSVWASILDFCYYLIDISESLNEVTGVQLFPLHRRITNAIDRTELRKIGKMIWDVVDLEESEQQRRTIISRGISANLDQVKDAYNSMDDLLSQTAIETVPELALPPGATVPKLSIVYIPQLGFHVTMPSIDSDILIRHGLGDDWQRMFTTDTGAYFKNHRMRKMDNDLGDLWARICDAEIEISHDLAQKVLEKELFLVAASELCGQLDALLALAQGASQYKLVRPCFVDENVIDIRAGRHLIQEMTVPAYIANDAFLVGGSGESEEADESSSEAVPPERPSMLLLTGPNYSGKSVYLKQIALIVYMAQVGSFVPADYARLGLTDKILTRVTARETVSRGQSSFMIDLQQISCALRAFTSRSLLVIDEFGKGTDNCDGAGLCAGVLKYLLSQGPQAPKVLASTHFHEIFDKKIIPETHPGLGLRQMEVQILPETASTPSQLVKRSEVIYLYNVRPGRSTLSYGAQCAAMNGIPSSIVSRACQLTDLALAGEDLVTACTFVSPDEAADLADAEAISRAFLNMDLDHLTDDQMESFKGSLDELLNIKSTSGERTTVSNADGSIITSEP